MFIKEIQNKKIWEDFILGCEEKTFLQSWDWGEFQKRMGNKIWRLGIYDEEKLISSALVSKIVAKRGTFLLIQHGPVLIQNTKIPEAEQARYGAGKNQNENLKFKILLDELKRIASKENCSFIRVAPLLERNEANIKLFKDLGFREAPMHANTYEATWKLDLSLSEEELLKNMRKTTRYLIRQAQKNSDIEISQSIRLEDVDNFNNLQREVAKLQHFIPFSLEYLKNEFLAFQSDNQVSLFFGRYQGKIVSSAIVLFWSDIGFYHQAALLPQYHKIPVAYLLQWEAIKEAKKRGCKIYDFWGFVDLKRYPHHPWAGPTLFKMGFGGQPYEYVKTQDFVISWKYWLTWIFEKIRRIRRRL